MRRLQWKPRCERPRVPDVDQAEGPAQGCGPDTTGPSTGRTKQTCNQPHGPRETGEGYTKTTQGNDHDENQRRRQLRDRRRNGERPKKILTEPIQVVQLNVNRNPDVMTIMQQEYILEQPPLTPIFFPFPLLRHCYIMDTAPSFIR